jgi:hypothetical protein
MWVRSVLPDAVRLRWLGAVVQALLDDQPTRFDLVEHADAIDTVQSGSFFRQGANLLLKLGDEFTHLLSRQRRRYSRRAERFSLVRNALRLWFFFSTGAGGSS